MTLRSRLTKCNMSMYRLSQISGVPKTTVMDICSGKSSIEGCNAKTVYKLALALGCSMEELMDKDVGYDEKTGLPDNPEYLDSGLPPYLVKAIEEMEKSWSVMDSGGTDYHWDCYWCALNSEINSAETENEISHERATYLRKKYLRMEDSDD